MVNTQCSPNFLCNGILEFIGKNNQASLWGIERMKRIDEEEALNSDEEMIMVYKCSCCQRLEFRANNVLNRKLNDRRIFFQQSSSVIQKTI